VICSLTLELHGDLEATLGGGLILRSAKSEARGVGYRQNRRVGGSTLVSSLDELRRLPLGDVPEQLWRICVRQTGSLCCGC
ncbi:unnamed protein product, partial [Brassica rapa subsp. narinosa]